VFYPSYYSPPNLYLAKYFFIDYSTFNEMLAGEFKMDLHSLNAESANNIQIFIAENWELFGPTMNALVYYGGVGRISHEKLPCGRRKNKHFTKTPISLFELAALSVKKHFIPKYKLKFSKNIFQNPKENFFKITKLKDCSLFARVMTVTIFAKILDKFYSNILHEHYLSKKAMPDRGWPFMLAEPDFRGRTMIPHAENTFFD
jgi:hypothetical protein